MAGGVMLLGGTSYATSVGEIRRVPLADGSIAAINTASAIDVKLDDAARHVRVVEGEAWFQVARDKQRPFVVAAGRARGRAVGTDRKSGVYGESVVVCVVHGGRRIIYRKTTQSPDENNG